jgi:hypothetical protein
VKTPFCTPLLSWPTFVPKPETLDQTDRASKWKASPAALDVTRRRLQHFQRSAPPYVSLNAPILLVRSDKAHDARRSRGLEFSADTDRSGSWLTMTDAPGAIFANRFRKALGRAPQPRKGVPPSISCAGANSPAPCGRSNEHVIKSSHEATAIVWLIAGFYVQAKPASARQRSLFLNAACIDDPRAAKRLALPALFGDLFSSCQHRYRLAGHPGGRGGDWSARSHLQRPDAQQNSRPKDV